MFLCVMFLPDEKCLAPLPQYSHILVQFQKIVSYAVRCALRRRIGVCWKALILAQRAAGET